jgi:hypothetical protein
MVNGLDFVYYQKLHGEQARVFQQCKKLKMEIDESRRVKNGRDGKHILPALIE